MVGLILLNSKSCSVMRKIYLPELLRINIKNFTLYPNGLDYTYDFIKGVNLILGGNGMGKTTFVNIIKYSIIGHYKKEYDYTKTYKGEKKEKRLLYPIDYYSKRMDTNNQLKEQATVTIDFKIDDKIFSLKRGLDKIELLSLIFDGEEIKGEIYDQFKYQRLNDEVKKESLLYKYEELIEKYSGLSFDDLIFYINEILFFGENHKTILWDESNPNAQEELFNKYFNSPELDKQRKEADRQAKYYDSLSRHRSEDIRAIKKVLDAVNAKKDDKNSGTSRMKIFEMNQELSKIDDQIKSIRELILKNASNAEIYQNKINELSLKANNLEEEKNRSESRLKVNLWEKLNPQYQVFEENIRRNHICPMCNKPNEDLYSKVLDSHDCFLCGVEINEIEDEDLKEIFSKISEDYKRINLEIQSEQINLKKIDDENRVYELDVRNLEIKKRKLQTSIRMMELSKDKENVTDEHEAFYDEIERLEREKEDFLEKSKKYSSQSRSFSNEIESKIRENTKKFSNLFSEYAEKFLGVNCLLTFDSFNNSGIKRFYPVIDGKIRYYEDELSESQRFFIDHSFRMSILSFFYQKPAFYIVETPDSSLDLSYEENAAKVFMKFLENPNILILTSNLNNSKFIDYIVNNNQDIKVKSIGLLEIAKRSNIQNSNEGLIDMYEKIKYQLKVNNYV